MLQGMPAPWTSASCAILPRKRALSASRSAPTTDSATWCCTPARVSVASSLRPAVWKNYSTARSSNEGALATPSTARAGAVSANFLKRSGGAAKAVGLRVSPPRAR